MAKNITLRNNTSTNSGKEAKMSHAEMDANLETFFMSSSLDGTTLYLHSTGSANVDSIDLSGLGGSGAQGIQGIQGTTGTGIQGIQGITGTGIQGTDGAQGTQGIAGGASAQGTQGIQGLEGTGTQGVQGIAGGASAQGTQGPQGAQGLEGTGVQGIQGIAGGASAQGIQGTTGIQGIQGPAAVGSQGTAIAPFAFASVNTTSNGSGINISWSNWDSLNSTLDFTFTTPQANTDYTVVTDSEVFDNYFVGITNKTVNGFTAEFYDDTQSRTPSTFAEFTFLVYASTPLVQTGVGAQGANGFQGIQGTTGIQGTQGIQGIAGTAGVDGISSGRTYYFNRSITEVAGRSQLGTSPTGGAETSMNVLSVQNTDTRLIDFISEPFDFTIIPGGVQRFQLWMTKENQTDDIEAFVVLKLTDNSGNILSTVGTSQATDIGWNNNNTTPVQVTVDITLPTAAVSIGQRMLVEVWTRNNENQNYTTYLYTEGASHYSYVVTTVEAQPGVQGIQGTQGIQGQGITANSLTLASSSETLGSHNDSSRHTVQTNWTRLAPSGASFTNASGKTKSYLVVFGLETSSTYSNSSPGPFNIDVRIADASTGAVVYTEWRDTVLLYRNTSEVQTRMTKTYVSHVYNLGDGDNFAIWVRGDSSLLGTLYVEYSLLTVTELTGLPAGTLN